MTFIPFNGCVLSLNYSLPAVQCGALCFSVLHMLSDAGAVNVILSLSQ